MAVTGVKELKTDLRKIKSAVRNATRAAAYAGAVEYRNALRKAAPTTNATARRSIAAKRKQGAQQGTGKAQVGLQGPAFYLGILSSGARSHEITARSVAKIIDPKTRKIVGKRARKRLVLAISTRPGRATQGGFLGPRVTHPGVRGRNWIGPVLDSTRTRALEAVADRYNKAIAKGKQSGAAA